MSGLFPLDARIGCVPYLNARPLVFGIEDRVTFEVPSLLAADFLSGRFDAALIPVVALLERPDAVAVDGVSISARGTVRSVILAHPRPLAEAQEIVLDPSSRSSCALLAVLVRGFFQISARLVEKSDDPDAARLIIGDPALEFQAAPAAGWTITDLGEAWFRWTGLPFVFAVWAVRPGYENAPSLGGLLRLAAAAGLEARPEISERQANPGEALDYLTRNIRYSLGDDEKAGLARFCELAGAAGLLPGGCTLPAWV
ncbi:MAG: menaquinone biosynthesis protein [Terrimicrobiaceae bacterium]|nr:menaquinone biosynthesis protein [Terrimicrobiaceae bacterium]